jgi:hypothetical protein
MSSVSLTEVDPADPAFEDPLDRSLARAALGSPAAFVDLADLVHVHEVVQVDAGERAADGKALACFGRLSVPPRFPVTPGRSRRR